MTPRSFVRHLGLRSFLFVLAAAGGSCVRPSTGADSSESAPEESVDEAEHALILKKNIFYVTDYGADPADFTDDTDEIKTAINLAVANGGGTVYFHRGEYDITDSLVLPRSMTKPIVFQGEGRAITRITTAGNLPSNKPVITFSGTESAKEFAFRDITLGRTDPGPVFVHDQPTPGTILWKAKFERVFFAAPDDTDGLGPGAVSYDLVHIKGAVLGRMEDVVFNGGHTGLRLEDSMYCDLLHLNTEQDLQTNHGVALVGGTGHSIHHALLGATDGGTSLSIEGGTNGISNIQVDGLSGGGKRTQSFIKLAGTSAAPVRNIVLTEGSAITSSCSRARRGSTSSSSTARSTSGSATRG